MHSKSKVAQRSLPQDPDAGAREAIEYYALKRATGPRKEVPVERLKTGLQQMKRMPMHSSSQRQDVTAARKEANSSGITPDLNVWTWLGPGNIGGRARTLIIDPNNPSIMFTAGVAGGVWKTTDSGNSWLPVSDVMANLAVTTLAFDPHNSQVIYAGTGEGFGNFDAVRGAGLFKSNDGGTSWTALPTSGSDWYYINKVLVSWQNSSIVYAATNTGLFRSVDGGQHFSNLYSGNCSDIAIKSDIPNQDYTLAACSQFGYVQVIRSTDASQQTPAWVGVLGGIDMGRTSLAFAPSDQRVVYALSSKQYAPLEDTLEGVYRSTDSGNSWIKVDSGTSAVKLNTVLLSNPLLAFGATCGQGSDVVVAQGWYDNVIAVDPVNPNRVWVGGIDLFRSDDGGANWGLVSYWWANGHDSYAHADQHAITFHPRYDGASNRTLFVANDGGVFRTDDADSTTATGPTAPCNPDLTTSHWTSLNNNLGITQFYNGAAYTSGTQYLGGTQDNGTVTGSDASGNGNWTKVLSGDGGDVAIDPINSNVLYAETPGLFLKKSTDGGQTWNPATNGIDDEGLFVTPFQLDPGNHNRLWTGGFYMWRSDDAAGSWTQAGTITPGNGYVSAIGVSPVNSNNVVAGLSDGFITYTQAGTNTNSSTSWAYNQPRPGFVSSLTFDPVDPNTVYATYSSFNYYATDAHVYKSTNGGATWTAIDGSFEYKLPDVPVHSIAINPFDSQQLYIGTDIGVFVSLDGGKTWNQENTGYVNAVTESLSITEQGNTASLLAFTHGRGVWRVGIRNLGLSATPILSDFGQIGLGTISSARAFVVTNKSSAPITVNGISITGEFSQTNDCGQLAPGATCQIMAYFLPLTAGLDEGTITISHSAQNSPYLLQVRGTGFSGGIVHLSTLSMSFGNVEVNRSSGTQTIILTNIGNLPLKFLGVGAQADSDIGYPTSDFVQSNDCPGGAVGLGAGLSCTIRLRFTPTKAGNLTAVLNASDDHSRNYVQLSGTATPITVAISAITPSGLPVGLPETELKITGSGFSPASVIKVNGVPRTMRYESATAIYFTATQADLSHPQFLYVEVDDQQNSSVPQVFTVYVPMAGNELLYDRFSQKLYDFDFDGHVTSLYSVDPFTGAKTRLVDISDVFEQGLTLSPDGKYIYFAVRGYNGNTDPFNVVRYDVETGLVEKRFALEMIFPAGYGYQAPFHAPVGGMVVSPSDSRDLIISKDQGGYNFGISFYKDGVLQGKSIDGAGHEYFQMSTDSSTIYNLNYFHPARVIQAYDSKGVEIIEQDTVNANTLTFAMGKNTIYKSDGHVVDAQSFAVKGQYAFYAPVDITIVLPDEIEGKAYYVGKGGITAFDMATFDQILSVPVAYDSVTAPLGAALIGKNQAAYTGAGRLRIFKRPGSTDPGPNQPTPRVDTLSPASASQGAHNLKIRITGINFTRWSVAQWNGSTLETDFVDSNTLTVYVPHKDFETIGSASITVMNPPDGGTSSAVSFSIQPAAVTVSDEFVNFGSVLLGRTRSYNISLTNNTGAALTLASVTLPDPAFNLSRSCAQVIAPGDGCSFSIVYAPTQAQQEYSTLAIKSDSLPDSVQIPIVGGSYDIVLNVPRASRPSRAGGSPIAMARVSLAPSKAMNVNATMSCGGLPVGMSCSVRPAVVNLSGGAQDVDVTVTMAAKSKRVAVQRLRASRLNADNQTKQPQSRTFNVTVTANVGGGIRNVSVPITIEQ